MQHRYLFFLISMRFEGHLRVMAAIMWSILRRHKPQKHGYRVSLSARLFTARPDGPGKDQSWVMSVLV